MNPESLAPETRILPLDQSPFFFLFFMKNKFEHCSLVTCTKIRNRRFLIFVKEIRNILNPYFISGFPRNIENTIFHNVDLAKKLGVSHLWIFSQENFFFFLTLVKTSFGPFISFRILKFSLRNEMKIYLDEKRLKDYSPILLLNNFFSKDKKCFIIKETLRKIFPTEESQKVLEKKFLKIILIDFNSVMNMVDFRCYRIKGNLILLPRKLRKLKNFKKMQKILKKNLQSWPEKRKNLLVGKDQILNLIRVEEIGPKFSAYICEISNKI